MSKTLVVLRNESATYQVHVQVDDPYLSHASGLSLDQDRLQSELHIHGCSDETVKQVLAEVDQAGRATVTV